MRFLCENCKAKYQIGDDKLQGRAVRMKCRKCGNVIDVSSQAGNLSGAHSPSNLPPPPAPVPTGRPVPTAAAVQRPSPVRPAAPAPPTSSAARPAPPRPRAAAVSGLRVVPASLPEPAEVTASQPVPDVVPVAAAPGGGLAGAFTRSVMDPGEQDVAAAIEVLSAGAAEEWYVGINGVPLGPVRLPVLRQKASQGLVTEESLVWREGFEEWLPLRTFPELAVLVREARDPARATLAPQPPQSRRPAASATRSGPVAVLKGPHEAPFIEADVGRISQPGPGPSIAPEDVAVIAVDPYAPKPAYAAQAAPGAFGQVVGVSADPFAAPLPAPVVSEQPRHSIVDDLTDGVKRQVRMHPAAYVMIAIAAGFGAMAAFVLLKSEPGPAPPPTIQVVTVTAPPAQTPAPVAAEAPAKATNGVDAPEVAVAPGGGRGGAVAAKGTEPAATPGVKDAPPAPVGLGMGSMVDGPSVKGPGAADPNLPAQLEQGDIERVVSANRGIVKRRCWEPALATRDQNAPSSTSVTASIVVGPSGRVQSASVSGGAGYPGLASCIDARVRSWTFPPSGGDSRATIPFKFFTQ